MVNSIPFFTQLQINKNEIPLFAIHLFEFIGKSDKLMEFENLSGDYGNNLKGAQIVMHNLENNAIEIRKDLKPGVYKFVNKILTFDYESYEISSCRAADEFLILPKEIGRFVNSGMEIARVQSPFNLVNDKGALLPFTRDIIKQLYKQLVHSSQIH
ncbi:hypothetical protein HY745_04515 [Candidatus Desantisbacteria bacterium]|nr:hypothetical protein [Candidatus Desantisbacteria bacterium]